MLRTGFCSLLLVIAACGNNDLSGSDAGTSDAGNSDAGSSDAGSSDAGSSDAGSSDAGISDGGTQLSTPIQAQADQWTFVPFDDAFCGNGSTTGLGINPHPESTQLLIYLEGGGACWNELTCYTLMAAANFTTGYSQADFESESTSTSYLAQPGGFFDRTAAGNPFKDYNFVYIPYCTGDVHAGSNVIDYGSGLAHHVGYENMAAFLKRIVPTFSNTTLVALAGSSAGGFGALVNWGQTQAAFGSARVDMIDDSGTFMPVDIIAQDNPINLDWHSSWNLAASIPAACTGCTQSLSALYGYYANALPGDRGALLSYTQDTVLPSYFQISQSQFTTGLNELLANEFTPDQTNLAAFTFSGQGHVLFFDPGATTNGTSVQIFLTKMVTGDAGWGSEHP